MKKLSLSILVFNLCLTSSWARFTTNTIASHEATFVSKVGEQKLNLYYRSSFSKNSEAQNKAPLFIIVHGLKDHSSRYEKLINNLQAQMNIEVWAYDQPHHGHSSTESWVTGEVESIDDNATHLKNFVSFVMKLRPGRPVYLFGHSMGGLVVTSFQAKYGDIFPIKGIVLSAPALSNFNTFADRVKMKVVGLAGRSRLKNFSAVPDFLDNRKFFEDREFSEDGYYTGKRLWFSMLPELEKLWADKLVNSGLHSLGTAYALIQGIENLDWSSSSLKAPYLIFHSKFDLITNPEGSKAFFSSVAGPHSKLNILEGFGFHDLPGLYSDKMAPEIVQWIQSL